MTLSLLASLAVVVVATLGFAEPVEACPGGDKADSCPFADEQIDVEAENLADGARLTLQADEKEQVDKIQEWASRFEGDGKHARHLEEKGAEVDVEIRPDGAQVTVRAEKPKFIKRLQRHFAQKAEGKGCGGHGHEKHCGHKHKKNCDHKKGGDCDCKGKHGEGEHAGHGDKGCHHEKGGDCGCKHAKKAEE